MAEAEAVTQATRLPDIQFPEFTAKLITDTFDALISANLRQTESYISLISAVGEGLTEYINNTKDDIGGDEILQFLAKVVPPADDDEENNGTKLIDGGTLNEEETDALKTALDEPVGEPSSVPDADVVIEDEGYNKILEAVAKRIAANKYAILEKMVQQGVLRLVVENGLIETRLSFSTHGSSFYQAKSNYYNRRTYNNRRKSRSSGIVALFGKYSSATTRNSITVSTAEKVDQDRTGSSVNIFGRVQINFKTDYLPLNE